MLSVSLFHANLVEQRIMGKTADSVEHIYESFI